MRAFMEDFGVSVAHVEAEAVLVRPDHYVFGTGRLAALADAFASALAAPDVTTPGPDLKVVRGRGGSALAEGRQPAKLRTT